MLRYTHIYLLIYRLVMAFAWLLVFALAIDSIGKNLIVIIVIGVGSLGIFIFLLRTFDWLPTFLYIRLTLSTKVSPSEADKLSFLFDGSLNGKWHPLLEIGELKPESRREALFQFAKRVAMEGGK